MIVLLLVMVGIGLDTGYMTYSRNTGQAAVDAAALAAVSGLPSARATGSDTPVTSRATAFTANNYTGSGSNPIGSANVSYVQYDFTSNRILNYGVTRDVANGVRVALEDSSAVRPPSFLTPLLNLMGISTPGSHAVNVSAVATITARPAIPIALWSSRCAAGNPVQSAVKIEMQHPDQNDSGENSCWTTFFDCSSGAPDIKAGFQTASTCSGATIDGNITLGSMICQNKGQVNTVMKTAEDFFMDKAVAGNWWIIPVIKGTGNCDAKDPSKVVDFAKIQVTKVDRTGSPKYIVANLQCGQSLNALDESFCFTHRLVREQGGAPGVPDKGY